MPPRWRLMHDRVTESPQAAGHSYILTGYPIHIISDIQMKTTIDVDRELADAAAEALGTSTLKETVNAALREVIDAAGRRELARALRGGELAVPTPEEVARARQPKLEPGALAHVVNWRSS